MDNKKIPAKAKELIREYTSQKDEKSDPNGSWTGLPESPIDVPVQDADDL